MQNRVLFLPRPQAESAPNMGTFIADSIFPHYGNRKHEPENDAEVPAGSNNVKKAWATALNRKKTHKTGCGTVEFV